MTKKEFVALLRLQNRRLVLCEIDLVVHETVSKKYAADILTDNGYLVMDGPHAKTQGAAVQRSIAKYYKQ